MKVTNKIFWSLFISGLLLSCDTAQAEYADNSRQNDKGKGKKEKTTEAASVSVAVVKKWDLPDILLEVSGIAYLGNNQFACVQDEAGVIFIYNTAAEKIDRTITFGAAGDYEGIALVGRTAYIVRSDGKIYEVNNIDTSSPKITPYETPLTAENNVEGLTYDAKNNRLLLVIKGAETGAKDYKSIYAFDLATKKLAAEPLFKLSLTNPVLQSQKNKKLNNALQPSELAIDPKTGNIYLTEAVNPQLFVLDASGKIISRHKLDEQVFTQPEGLTFSPEGDLYISNEGKKGKGNIIQVKITN